MPDVDLLLHPVRLRIVAEFSRRERTTAQVQASLSDVPQASLYRHIATLVDGGVLEVVDERPVRGAVERTYRVRHGGDRVRPDQLPDLDADEQVVLFTTFTAALMQTFSAAVHRGDPAELLDAGLSYAGTVVHLTPEEREHYAARFTELAEQMMAHEPGPGRRPHTVSTITIPHPPDHGTDDPS